MTGNKIMWHSHCEKRLITGYFGTLNPKKRLIITGYFGTLSTNK